MNLPKTIVNKQLPAVHFPYTNAMMGRQGLNGVLDLKNIKESSSFIEKVDISDGSANMMGMVTGQSFYKLTKVSAHGSPRPDLGNREF